ncbi:MAG TPA: TrmO family methyltransferase [Pseudonocardiaceae bacterium]
MPSPTWRSSTASTAPTRPTSTSAHAEHETTRTGLDLHVEELDAIDGTPVLDIKPWFREFGPRGTVRQAAWSTEMLTNYFATPPQDS